MPKIGPPYAAQFREEAVRLVRSRPQSAEGKPLSQVVAGGWAAGVSNPAPWD